MRRFAQNRWWTFILTLSLLLAASATISSPSYGGGPGDMEMGDGGGGGAGGDPDSPTGGGNRSPGYGRAAAGRYQSAVTPVGDGGSATSVWVWRLHVVLRSLMSRYLR